MTILELLKKASLAVNKLDSVLDRAAAAMPDLAPEIATLKAELDLSIAPENLAALASEIPQELLAIAQGHLSRARHAGDAT